MKVTHILVFALAGLALSVRPSLAQAATINSFETAAELSQVVNQNTVATPVSSYATDGKHSLKVDFLPGAWSVLRLQSNASWNLTGGSLAFDVTNPGAQPTQFGIELDDLSGHLCAQHITINPGATATFRLVLDNEAEPNPMTYGMQALPNPYPGTQRLVPWASSVDLTHIQRVVFYKWQTASTTTLAFDNVRFMPSLPLASLLTASVDSYGQYMYGSWPGKLAGAADFVSRRASEEAGLAGVQPLADRDIYGGWAAGPQLPQGAFFRTINQNGKWWLVTPAGHLFFSVGIDTVSMPNDTLISGREYMFSSLPSASDPLSKHFGWNTSSFGGTNFQGKSYDFYSANLERKYGPNYRAPFYSTATARLRSWGFNTYGNCSDPSLYNNNAVTYTARVDIQGSYNHIATGRDYWGPMSDPFDPQFAVCAAASMVPVTSRSKNDPWLIGYFVDNELSWVGVGAYSQYGIAFGTLAQNAAKSPAKQAFLTQMQAKYPTIALLNQAWGTSFSNWGAWSLPQAAPAAPTAQQAADMSAYLLSFASKYFSVVRTALKAQDPNHLYLGCRFEPNWYTPEVLKAAAANCDVVSFNIYETSLDPAEWAFTNGLNKPCIVGEFHFGALDHGMFSPGLVAAKNQQDRGVMYQAYVRSVLNNPAFVGCHWFRYADEPLTGRFSDGENFGIGFVDVTDTPYPELVSAATTINQQIYTLRSGAGS